MLGSATFTEDVVVADFEAGVGTLTRLAEQRVDTVVVVAEATPKSMEVGTRAVALAKERSIGRVVVVANRVRNDEDLEIVKRAFPGLEVIPVPDDPMIVEADRLGIAPIDHSPEGPAVLALIGLAHSLVPSDN